MLYQLSYTRIRVASHDSQWWGKDSNLRRAKPGRFTVCCHSPLGHPTDNRMATWACHTGADEGTRTLNLLITNQLLCQLSYASGGRGNSTDRYSRRT